MAILKINGDTSGSVSLTVPAAAGTNTATIPASTGNVLLDSTVGVCRAWVNFNGTGTVAIRASFNVSSITDNGVGDYTVNFTNALSDANYASQVSCGGGAISSSLFGGVRAPSQDSPTTSSYRFRTVTTANATEDKDFVSVSIFR